MLALRGLSSAAPFLVGDESRLLPEAPLPLPMEASCLPGADRDGPGVLEALRLPSALTGECEALRSPKSCLGPAELRSCPESLDDCPIAFLPVVMFLRVGEACKRDGPGVRV